MFEDVWIDIWVFYLVPLVLLSVLKPVPDCFQYCSSVVEFEVRDCDASRSSFIHLDLSFVHGDRYGSIFSLLQVDVQLSQHHLLSMLSFPFDIFCFFVKNQVFEGMWIDIRVLDSEHHAFFHSWGKEP